DLRRVFEYHGAEHMSIHALEHGDELTPDNVEKYRTLHLRCGTAFVTLALPSRGMFIQSARTINAGPARP
ncbi:MAG: DUF1385 domain-containing protein, partial [Chloroflexi bacterium]|nr:DUF1385 domain-containing protein [Chloroflexota bacterium]